MNEQKLSFVMRELGHDSWAKGNTQLAAAVRMYSGQPLTKELYPMIAKASGGGNGATVERRMRYAVGQAWERAPVEVRNAYFGTTIGSGRRAPTLGQYIARLREIADED